MSISAANHLSSPPTGSIQPSPECSYVLGFQPAAALSGCRCLVPRARRGWPGSPRRCRDGRCQSAASAGSEMPQPSPGPRRTLALMCTRKRRRVVHCLLGRSDLGHGSPHRSFSDGLSCFHPSIYEAQQLLAPCNDCCPVDS